MENTIQMDDDWGYPYFRKAPFLCISIGNDRKPQETIGKMVIFQKQDRYASDSGNGPAGRKFQLLSGWWAMIQLNKWILG